ncbi:glycosyl transferase family 3 [Marinomonas ushuaiensis DSM 15871]|uniref:Glycosyl transferase family 3 n=1 Tax=Marinomonas ushuaiensis DSM 15871 TaxID=1122207 RepID=X7E1W3_9GAMM|nr:glycosyl transferase family protein [Marinomonas ushuaiensis]ETX09850.1 glycosyl transferase family 3 [Marinomonas ushuaiensis DSM 15871]
MSNAFTQYVKILGRGKKGSRTLTIAEAYQAMSLILSGNVEPEQLGAFWMLIRIREETVDETVGFTKATRAFLYEKEMFDVDVDLDWPAYAGKRNELPWFLLAALALANYGVKTVMHGHVFKGEERIFVEQTIQALGLPICHSPIEVEQSVVQNKFAYMPLSDIDSTLSNMMNLKYTLGLRSPVNTVVRMMNPFGAAHSVHGVFHTGYDILHVSASEKLKDPSVLIFRGGNGEAEVNPERDVTLWKWQKGESSSTGWLKAEKEHKRLKNNLDLSRLIDHWSGEEIDQFGDQAVRQTIASVAGLIYGVIPHEECLALADEIWSKRNKTWLVKVV